MLFSGGSVACVKNSVDKHNMCIMYHHQSGIVTAAVCSKTIAWLA